jgi:hypothetical protein
MIIMLQGCSVTLHPLTSVQVFESQITLVSPEDSHLHQKLAYKQGLWLVQGTVLNPKDRPNGQTVFKLMPSLQDLTSCMAVTVCLQH